MKALLICLYFFLLLFIFLPQKVLAGDVVINEIMYDLSGTDTDREWIEIYNKGSSSIDLVNWRFKEGGTKHILNTYQGGLVLNAGNYAVIVDNPSGFLNDHSGFSGTIIDSSFLLSNTSETLTLLENTDAVTPSDEVTYQSSWGGAGTGGSLERKSATAASNDANNWQESMVGGTPGIINSSGSIPSPTPTLTPLPSPTPVPTSKPTSAKSPTKTPATPVPTQKISSPIPSAGQILRAATIPKINVPTSILGQSTKSATAIPTPKANNQKKEVKILGGSQNNIFKILIGAGGLFIVSCAILLFRHYKNKKINNE